jgi:hypothetical protein
VTMHQPGSWIVRLKGENNPSTCGKEGHIATRRVVEIERCKIGSGVEDTISTT